MKILNPMNFIYFLYQKKKTLFLSKLKNLGKIQKNFWIKKILLKVKKEKNMKIL